jgi:FkbM family methyltransferase
MPITSYAQNGEDILLDRAFSQMEGPGFYIDVGAAHPTQFSVTRAFYLKGWRGINIEPAAEYMKLLRRHRPQDINLPILVSNLPARADGSSASETFYRVSSGGLSTTISEFKDRAREQGWRVDQRQIPCMTLDQVCEKHWDAIPRVDNVPVVHFLKIDVEGAEHKVLQGFSFKKVRPIVLVIEAFEPNSQIPSHGAWAPYVESRGYKLVYEDGLNRFYLANEHMHLQQHFKYPPNVNDKYEPLAKLARRG